MTMSMQWCTICQAFKPHQESSHAEHVPACNDQCRGDDHYLLSDDEPVVRKTPMSPVPPVTFRIG